MNRLPHLESPTKSVRAALALLAANARLAGRLRHSPWDHAADRAALRQFGLADADLRALVEGGHVEAGTLPGLRGTFFILTPSGHRLARALARPGGARGRTPRWDRASRALWFGGDVVKRVGRGAFREEALLEAMERAGWPPLPRWLPSPFRGEGKVGPRRLRDAVDSLNDGLGGGLEFEADGRAGRFGYRIKG